MSENIFEKIHERKQNILKFVQTAKENGVISSSESEAIEKKINEDKLTLGVIGQMKCGKSTFLNSLIFGDDVLPAATTPMTASLSIITYGAEKKVEAEFYTREEWNNLIFENDRVLDENARESEKAKHQAAQELVAKSRRIGSEIGSLLGKQKCDDFNNLIEYVGADGKYISITKSVKIYYPKDYLKGVEIVDTPGFNDPIVSREERTKEFLKGADAVLMLLYAGQPFSATDKSIIFDNVRACGVAKVLMGINKYDIPYEQGEDIKSVCAYVKSQVLDACKSYRGEEFALMLRDIEPMPVSANMALLSKMEMSKIRESEIYTHDLQRFYDIFEISNQQSLLEKSLFREFENKLLETIMKNKDEIIFKKPIAMIDGICASKQEKIQKSIVLKENECQNYLLNDDDIENKKSNLERACKRVDRKLSSMGDDIEEQLAELIRRGGNDIRDGIDSSIAKLKKYVETSIGIFTSENEVSRNVNDVVYSLEKRCIPDVLENTVGNVKPIVKKRVDEFIDDVIEILQKYLPEVDAEDVVKGVRLQTDGLAFSKELIKEADIEIKGFFNNVWYGAYGFAHKGKLKDMCYEFIDKIKTVNPVEYFENLKTQKDVIIEKAKKPIIDEFLNPMQEQLDSLEKNVGDKKAAQEKAQHELDSLKAEKDDLQVKSEVIKKKKIELGL